MKTVDEVYEIIEELNNTAHNQAWDTWMSADELGDSEDEDDWSRAEEMREEASLEQAGYFRDEFYELDIEDRDAIEYWVKHDEDFRDQLRDWFGHEEFTEQFGVE